MGKRNLRHSPEEASFNLKLCIFESIVVDVVVVVVVGVVLSLRFLVLIAWKVVLTTCSQPCAEPFDNLCPPFADVHFGIIQYFLMLTMHYFWE